MARKTIDLTPTWRGIMPALLAAVRDGTPESRSIAIEELNRLADFADAVNRKPEPLGPVENVES